MLHRVKVGKSYAARRSLSAFHNREMIRAYGDDGAASGDWVAYALNLHYFVGEPRAVFEANQLRVKQYIHSKCPAHPHLTLEYPDYDLPVEDHADFKSFYSAIGYDYKKKKFL